MIPKLILDKIWKILNEDCKGLHPFYILILYCLEGLVAHGGGVFTVVVGSRPMNVIVAKKCVFLDLYSNCIPELVLSSAI